MFGQEICAENKIGICKTEGMQKSCDSHPTLDYTILVLQIVFLAISYELSFVFGLCIILISGNASEKWDWTGNWISERRKSISYTYEYRRKLVCSAS